MPALSDLRESGSLEQDADMVILLHRDSAYEKESARPGEADLIVAKHRNGPTKTITVAFQGHLSRFADMPRARRSLGTDHGWNAREVCGAMSHGQSIARAHA